MMNPSTAVGLLAVVLAAAPAHAAAAPPAPEKLIAAVGAGMGPCDDGSCASRYRERFSGLADVWDKAASVDPRVAALCGAALTPPQVLDFPFVASGSRGGRPVDYAFHDGIGYALSGPDDGGAVYDFVLPNARGRFSVRQGRITSHSTAAGGSAARKAERLRRDDPEAAAAARAAVARRLRDKASSFSIMAVENRDNMPDHAVEAGQESASFRANKTAMQEGSTVIVLCGNPAALPR